MSTTSTASLDVFPSPVENGDYLALLKIQGDIPEPVITPTSTPCNIIILDISGSMGQFVKKCCNTIFPAIFKAHGFNEEDSIHLLRFESQTHHNIHKVSKFPSLTYKAQGGTDLRGVFPILKKILAALQPGTYVRILTVSDGDVLAPDDTCKKASELNDIIQTQLNLQIDSTAIRLFTSSYANPDTRALSSVLQFNTTSSTPTLIDINFGKTVDEIIELMTPHFGVKNITSYLALPNVITPKLVPGSPADIESPNALFKQHPWVQQTCKLPIRSKKTLFWISKKQYDDITSTSSSPDQQLLLTLSDVLPVTINFHQDGLNGDLYEQVIASRIDYYMMQVKLLRVIGTQGSLEKLQEMSKYFIQMEKQLYSDVNQLDNDNNNNNNNNVDQSKLLNARIQQLTMKLKKQNSRLGLQMAQIANMDATTQFNAAQAATFLRSTSGAGKASKGLVRRAGEDLDFDQMVHEEVNTMAKNLSTLLQKITPEIENDLKSSFVSLATTMDGIRAVCELAKTSLDGEMIELKEIGVRETLLTQLSAIEILSILNVVGIPVQSTIGDYPDPYRYNINIMFTGHYCSLSDLINLHEVVENSDGTVKTTTLHVPGYDSNTGRIDNVIPLLENKDIYHFLHSHAPRMMSLYSSIGMRRVLAHIWETPHATLSAALIKLMRIVMVEPTTVNFTALQQIYQSFAIFDRLSSPYNYINIEFGNAIGHIKTASKQLKVELSQQKKEKERQAKDASDNTTTTTTTTSDFKDPNHILLPQIQTQLTSLIYPLVNLYRNKKIKIKEQEKPLLVNDDEISTILRAVYFNEVWHAVRSTYRGKSDGPLIVQQNVNALAGFDQTWTPQLTSLEEEDLPFDPKQHLNGLPDKISLFKSTTWKSCSKKLSRLDIILALPFFSELFNAYDTNSIDLINDVQSNLMMKVLVTPETPSLLQKQQELNALKTKLGQSDDNDDNDDFDDEDDYYANDNKIKLTADEKKTIQTQIKEIIEENQGQRQEVRNNVEMLWSKVFFNKEVDGETIISSSQHINYMKLMAIISSFIHSESNQRFPEGQYTPQNLVYSPEQIHSQYISDIDYTDDISSSHLALWLTQSSIGAYQRLYDSHVTGKVKKAKEQIFIKYRELLLNTDDIDIFINLLKNGLHQFHYSAKYTGFQDPQFNIFWNIITKQDDNDNDNNNEDDNGNNDKNDSTTDEKNDGEKKKIPLLCEKLKILILGQDENKNHVWNQGRILYDHSLQNVSKFFYHTQRRTEWIEISKEYQERRKQWAYRATDLPNRHSHHLTHPSYYALGYDTLIDFRAGVDKDVYNQYCQKHQDCCGLTPLDKKRKHLGKMRHDKSIYKQKQ